MISACYLGAHGPQRTKPNVTVGRWNSWGTGASQTRFQPAERAGIPAGEVPHLAGNGLSDSGVFPHRPADRGWGLVYIGTDNGAACAGCRDRLPILVVRG